MAKSDSGWLLIMRRVVLVSSLVICSLGVILSKSTLKSSTSLARGVSKKDQSVESNSYSAANRQILTSSNVSPEIEQRYAAAVAKLSAAQDLSEIILSKTELEAYLRQYPELIKEIPDTVRSGNLPPRNTLALIHSLGMVGGVEAENNIIALFDDKSLNKNLRIQAIVAGSELENPSDQVVNSLWKLANDNSADIANAALLNIGIIISNLQGAGAERYGHVLNDLISSFQKAQQSNSSEAAVLMEALANTGAREIIPIVSVYLDSPSPKDRSAAALALRRVSGADIEALLVGLVSDDETPDVRRAAVEALQGRSEVEWTENQLSELLFDEPNAGVRAEIIRYFGARLDSFPQSRGVIRELLSRESDPRNYELAIQYLHTEGTRQNI